MEREIILDEDLRFSVERRGTSIRIGWADEDGSEANIYVDREQLDKMLAAIQEVRDSF